VTHYHPNKAQNIAPSEFLNLSRIKILENKQLEGSKQLQNDLFSTEH